MRRIITTILLLAFMVFSLNATATTAMVGKTVAVVGSVFAQHQGEDKQHPLQVRQPVFLYDVIESGVGSRGKFMMKDDSILKLGPNSKIILDELMVGEGQQKSTVKQLKGHLRTLLGKKLKPKSHFRIETPVAVAGVRGTDFEVIVGSGGITAVRCFEGEVEVKNLMDSVPGQVILVPNVYTIVEEGKPPTPPAPIPAGQPLQTVLGAQVAKSSDDEEQEKDSGTVAESPDTEDTTEGGHSDPDSEGGDSSGVVAGTGGSGSSSSTVAAGAASTDQTSEGGTALGSREGSGTLASTETSASASDSAATEPAASSTSSSASSSTSPGGAVAGDSSGNVTIGSSATTGSVMPAAGSIESSTSTASQDSGFDTLVAQEIQQVSSNDFSEGSDAGQEVIQQLGITETGSVASNNTFISDQTIDVVMDNVVEDSLGVGPEDTVSDPITDYGSISFDINFPTP